MRTDRARAALDSLGSRRVCDVQHTRASIDSDSWHDSQADQCTEAFARERLSSMMAF